MALPANKPKVLITGLRGFTGKHLVPALIARHYDVHGLVHDLPKTASEYQVNIHNVTELYALLQKVQPQYIIHLAAVSFVAHDHAEDFYRTNLFGTLNLLKAIQDAQVIPQKILIASSANVYGNPTQADPLTELDIPLPINHYANSKLAMEHMVRLWFDDLPIIMTRPFNYTGPGQSKQFLISKIVSHFCDEEKNIQLGNMDVIRDISDVSFVVEAYIRLLESPIRSEIFNICSNKGYSILDALEYMYEIAGYKINVNPIAELMRKNEIKKLVGSNKKLTQAVGQIPAPSLYEILTRMYTEEKVAQ